MSEIWRPFDEPTASQSTSKKTKRVKRTPDTTETSVISEAWITERTKGWEAVALRAKMLILRSHSVPSEVKAYYQKSKLTAIMSRCQRCVKNSVHVVNTEDASSNPEKQQNTRESDSNVEMSERDRSVKKKQKESQKFLSQERQTSFLEDTSSDEWSDMKYAEKRDPEERRDRGRREKRKIKGKNENGADDEDGSDSEEPRRKNAKSKSELQREALEKHSLMCDAALSTMHKMQGLFEKIKDKI